MNKKKRYAVVSVTCALALSLAGITAAFAAEGDPVEPAPTPPATTDVTVDKGSADMNIAATVAKEDEAIVSVTVPSTMALAITTDADGAFKSATSPEATVTNNSTSNKPVKITLNKVVDTAPTGGSKLLSLVGLTLKGSEATGIALTEGADLTDVLFASLGVGTSSKLSLTAAAKAGVTSLPTNSGYSVVTTLKVEAIEVVAP